MRRDLLGAGSRGCPIRKAWRPGTRPWATSRASAARRSRGSATGIDEGAGEFLTRPLDHTWFLYVFVRRHPPGRESGPAGGLPSPGGRHRRVGPGAPGDPGTWPWGTPRPPTSGSAFLRSLRERGLKVPSPTIRRAWCWSPVTRTPVSGPRSRRSCPGPPGRRCRAPLRLQHHHPGWVRSAPEPVNALVSTIFAPTSPEAVMAQYKRVVDSLREAFWSAWRSSDCGFWWSQAACFRLFSSCSASLGVRYPSAEWSRV